MTSEFAPIFKPGRAERLQLVVDLWDSLAVEDSVPDLSAARRDELRRRTEKFAANPGSGRTWEEVKQRARAAHD